MRFSVIVPVYNVEKYIEKCLNSILNQTYKDFEIIIVNDGSPDNSQSIVDKYVKNYPEIIKSYIKENGGLSDARNFGVKKANGDYLVFVDSDDYINSELLEKLNEEIEKYPDIDIVGYDFNIIDNDYNYVETINKPYFSNLNGEVAIQKLILGKKYFEPAWGFIYRLSFWKENHFEYPKGKLHEDLGLTLEVILKAQKVSTINYSGYCYYQSDNSITRNKNIINISKERKKAFDILYHFDRMDNILKAGDFPKKAKKFIYSYMAGSVLWKLSNIPEEIRGEYIHEIKKRKLTKYIISNSLREKKYFILYRLKYKI